MALNITVFTKSANFPEDNTKRPNVWSWCKLSSNDGLNGHPLQWNTTCPLLNINLICFTRHSKVCDLQHFSFINQNISTSQVSVNYSKTGEILLYIRYKLRNFCNALCYIYVAIRSTNHSRGDLVSKRDKIHGSHIPQLNVSVIIFIVFCIASSAL